MEIAKTILAQLGGNGFVMMTGSYNLIAGDSYLSMKLRRNKAGASCMRITLTPADTYTVEFFRIRKYELIPLSKHEDIYCDQLQDLFEEVTGLYVTLRPRS